MRKLLIFTLAAMLSVGAFAGDYTSSFKHITHTGNVITNVDGTINMTEDWTGEIEMRTDSWVYVEELYDSDQNPVVDPNDPLAGPLDGVVYTYMDRNESVTTASTSIVDGTFGYTSTAVTYGDGYMSDSNGVGAGGGFRSTVVTTDNYTGEYDVVSDIDGTFDEDSNTTTSVDYDPLTGAYDGDYTTVVSSSSRVVLPGTPGSFTRDTTTTFASDAASTTTTTIEDLYSTAYSDLYN